ncbi:MAG: DNA mismatch repair endonuclease MutL [Chloroflexota bacterium]|nr:DNA mismatch repair endonuclease MutL [Chloroflexota bacterium]
MARIAAGEVVERPASVVKELVENALDAGASEIAIEATGGGISLIRVADDGSGIPASEVALAFERYATSKISSDADLESISSLGFRGEALPSIAAVAQVEMVTRAADEAAGTFISLMDGAVTGRRSQARPTGTTVTVRSLFRRVPARLKFLKSAATESSHIASVVSQYALAFPGVRFSLSLEGRTTLRTPGSGQLIDVVSEVYGLEVARNMLPVGEGEGEWSGGNSQIRVTGLAGAPSLSRASRGYLSFFVNRRWINSRLLAWAVEEAYHGLLMAGKHPVAIINIVLPPGEVDVNIHPTKAEVKFQDEHRVFGAVQKAVRQALIARAPAPRIEEIATTYRPTPTRERELWTLPGESAHTQSPPMTVVQPLVSTLPVLRVLGQLANSYIIAEGPDGLYLIDQHAAHERILFDKISSQQSARQPEVQGLLEPATFEVSPPQAATWQSHLADLAMVGFNIEPFGDRTYLVRAVPAVIAGDWAGVLREMLDAPGEGSWEEGLAKSMACHGAVRAGQSLSIEEMRDLVRQMEQTATPQTCPHGRPTLIRLTAAQLRREFGRS